MNEQEQRIEEMAKWYCKSMGWQWKHLDDISTTPNSPPSKESMRKFAREIVMQVELIWCKELLQY